MSRDELLSFIRNAVLMGDTLNIYDLGGIYSYLDLDSLEFEIFKNSFNGSVEFNRMYFKERDGKIILTFCAANYKYIDLGDAVDIIGPLAFASNSSLVELKSETVTVIERQAFYDCTSLKSSIRNLTYKYSKLLECRNKIMSLLNIA